MKFVVLIDQTPETGTTKRRCFDELTINIPFLN